ncbi:hypothetical protein E1180_17145 [Roseibium denhamense]|uniref:Uncharacterized protein n=1 Tax=Roseibium denhamense TaxID=76305 RepID=A0ABY1P4S1_9HYPH|nr:hypothetical protein [Roseibium denhamense]MTI07232.1 hypothetical protein [Roseibium denhamense]SMP26360.1 hypothetical protein SAMN06265374_2718 [Roseibium denhamense]
MATNTLVETDIEAGIELVRALDSAFFGVVAALWLYQSDTDKWKFVIACTAKPNQIESKILEAAQIVANHRNMTDAPHILDLSRVRIVGNTDPLISGLKPVIRLDGLGRVQFSNNLINGIYIEDAVIHRMAA